MIKTLFNIRKLLSELENSEKERSEQEIARRDAIQERINAIYNNSTKVFSLGTKG